MATSNRVSARDHTYRPPCVTCSTTCIEDHVRTFLKVGIFFHDFEKDVMTWTIKLSLVVEVVVALCSYCRVEVYLLDHIRGQKNLK